jgi:phosphotransferase system enzyme I (PtsI)
MPEVTGIGVSPGRAVGQLVHMPDSLPEPAAGATIPEGADPVGESERVAVAAGQVRAELELRAQRAAGDAKGVLEATALMAADPTLVAGAQGRVKNGMAAERAVWEAAGEAAAALEAVGGYMAERARDVGDVRDRIIAQLVGKPGPGVPDRDEPFVLAAHDLAPADTAILDPKRCVAIVTERGGPTSHTAILARALGMPAVVAASGVMEIAEDTTVLVDGAAGFVEANPSNEQIAKAHAVSARRSSFGGTGRLADDTHIPLLANVGDLSSADEAVAVRAEGVGLFRTEFCFLDRAEEPTVEEQVKRYREVFERFPDQRVVVRTLDAGADKPLPFLTDATEANPALGLRGYRTSSTYPQVTAHQLDALSQAAENSKADVWVMAPMIATIEEAESFVAICAEFGLDTAGVMIEIPAAALASDAMLQRVAFASIGTNDLTQYTMAADRLHSNLAALNNPWQPAALRLIQFTGDAGQRSGKPVGVCGEAAADPALAAVLVGLGVSSLSMTPRSIPNVADVLATLTRAECEHLAELAVEAPTATAARLAVRAELPILEELGL